jgi:hypothetical protein
MIGCLNDLTMMKHLLIISAASVMTIEFSMRGLENGKQW